MPSCDDTATLSVLRRVVVRMHSATLGTFHAIAKNVIELS
jgi:hypothetical protein